MPTAQAQGISVNSITLFLFGGVSDIQREPPSPRAEFLITIVGPNASVVLGILFTLLGATFLNIDTVMENSSALFSQVGPLTTILLWLGPINLWWGFY